MLRLTLRSGRDGRLLARIIDRDGVAFVLDYGEPEVVADASRKVLAGGFGVLFGDHAETAAPGHPSMLRLLALHYAAEGLLVAVEEPDWPRAAWVPPEDPPRLVGDGPPTLMPDEPTDTGDDTELLSMRDLARALLAVPEPEPPPVTGPAPLVPFPLPDLSEDDEATELVDDDDTIALGRRPADD